jgi:hypothetical protein
MQAISQLMAGAAALLAPPSLVSCLSRTAGQDQPYADPDHRTRCSWSTVLPRSLRPGGYAARPQSLT